jgi:cytochrome c-type biogenesis protein CcmH/NrfG
MRAQHNIKQRNPAMSQARIDAFTAMLNDQPNNEMIWYGLANEYAKLERWPDACAALRQVIRLKPDYTSAYQLLGTAPLQQGHSAEARQAWETGLEVAQRTGAWKARQHMEGLLKGVADNGATQFCE